MKNEIQNEINEHLMLEKHLLLFEGTCWVLYIVAFSVAKWFLGLPTTEVLLAMVVGGFGHIVIHYVITRLKFKSIRAIDIAALVNYSWAYLLIAIAIYYLGASEWMGLAFFVYPIVYAGAMKTKITQLMVTLEAVFLCALLVFLEYFRIIPHHHFIHLNYQGYLDFNWIIFAGITMPIGLGITLAICVNWFSGRFQQKSQELEEKKGELEESKTVLEVKVKARTKELEQERTSLAGKVKERTAELQEKIEELEKFNKFTVGRELKMVELKKKIQELEKRFKGREE